MCLVLNVSVFVILMYVYCCHDRFGLEKEFHVKLFRPIAHPKLANSRQC